MSNFSNDMSKEIASVLQRTPLVIRPSKVKVDIDAETTDADNLPPPLQPIIMSSSPACSQLREIVSVNFTAGSSKVLQELEQESKGTTDEEDTTRGGDDSVEGDIVGSSELENPTFVDAKSVDERVAVDTSGNENPPAFSAEKLTSDIVPCMADDDENASTIELANKNVPNADSVGEKADEIDVVNENITRLESANEIITGETL